MTEEKRLEQLRNSTPARIGVSRTGTRPLTKTLLDFLCDHAAAVDAVYSEVCVNVLEEYGLFMVKTACFDKANYLQRPDMGRILTEESVTLLRERCQLKPQVQIVVSDGLSADAINTNLRDVFPALLDSLRFYHLTFGTPFFVKGGRVACMDHIGKILQPDVIVLLIGERPGLTSAQSMSAYMCYSPQRGVVESDRNVISNIHPRGASPVEAGAHIGSMLKLMLDQKTSGVHLKEL